MPRDVDLIDPIDSVSNLPNGTPKLEDLFIFAELMGERRARSVLTLSSNENKTTLSTQLGDANINMLGVDFKPNVNNSAKFTTKWTNNETNTDTLLEGFGIKTIDVKIDSSYMPKVKIEFVDIRGLTFYNLGENSPYSLLFDFPPPLFKMTLKGFYGKSLDYDLHLVKHNTRFDSNDGNYYITVEFVARTFAPLADIPFKFAEIVALMSTRTGEPSDPKLQEAAIQSPNSSTNQEELNFDPRVEPRNTYELVEKLKRLTDELKNLTNSSEESQALDDARAGVNEGEDIVRFMNFFNGEVDPIHRNKAAIILKKSANNPDENTKDDGGQFRTLTSVTAYRDVIKSSEDEGNNLNTENTKLYLGILSSKVRDGNVISGDTNTSPIDATLTRYRDRLLTRGIEFSRRSITDGTIGDVVQIENQTPEDVTTTAANESSDNFDRYRALDITSFFIELDKLITQRSENVDEAKNALVEKVNKAAEETLGWKPSIYNIFKILCDDLDTFFRTLGAVSRDAETHHNKYFNRIVDEIQEDKSKNVTKRIYPFPLYVETEVTCGVTRKVRRVPPENLGVEGDPFPEIVFINRFIDRIVQIRKEESINDLRTQIDVNGNNKWIPITPADSILHNGAGYDSPYANIENSQFGDTNDDIINEIYRRLINRFYIASQYTYGDAFYSTDTKSAFLFFWNNNELKRDDLIKLIAKSEAINLANSLINDQVLDSLRQTADAIKSTEDLQTNFYSQIEELPIFNTVPNNGVLRLTDGKTSLIRDRGNPNFVGMEIPSDIPSTRINNENSNDPIERFLNIDEPWWRDFAGFFNPEGTQQIQRFTTENIPYFIDNNGDDDPDQYITSYLNGLDTSFNLFSENDIQPYQNIYTKITSVTRDIKIVGDPRIDLAGLYSNGNYATTLATVLAQYSDEVKTFLDVGSTYSDTTQAFVLASVFGRARSYFSELGGYYGRFDQAFPSAYRGNINSKFRNPAVVEVPRFSAYYMGGLIKYNNNPEVSPSVTFQDEIEQLLNEEWFQRVSVLGLYIDEDATRIQKLSQNDTNNFSEYYNDWENPANNNSGFIDHRSEILQLISDIENSEQLDEDSSIDDRQEVAIQIIKDSDYRSIDDDMMAKTTILNYSEYTFSLEDNQQDGYDPLSVTNTDVSGGTESRSAANDTFFATFWRRLAQELPERVDEINAIENDFRSVVDDEDIKTQLYYSYKNISDKWVSGIDTVERGFPLNQPRNDSLISKFAFVDRAMNPIGEDCIINAEALIEMSQDYDLNMFQVFSRLLSLNGFEFFPLQNFMSYKANEWEDAFRPFTKLDQESTPAFVCMYLGGTSSTLENSPSAFDNDGILDLKGEGLPDFNNVGECEDSQEVKDSETRQLKQGEARFKYSEPKAFRVRFAEQNQSFFTNIEISGRDFPETSDSLAILSRIAGDGKTTAPTPKGQNLFSIYENRAYQVTVTMLGNVMIQPTQYFQLENIPMYSGAYLITEVNHSISDNHMTTTFKGTKVLKFPNPYVTNFATVVGIDGGTSEDTSGNDTPFAGKSVGDQISAKTLPDRNSGKYNNEQFTLKISP